MRIISWNVNGIRAILKKGFLDWVEKESPDVICIQETKANSDQVESDAFPPKGYTAFWNSAERKGYSGVLTLTKKKPKSITMGMGIEEFDKEGRIIRTEFPKFDLLNVYFPNGTSGEERLDFKMRFYDAFLNYCEDLKKSGKKLIITGDVNTAHCPIDLKNDKANQKNSGFLPQERAWLDKFIDHGFVDTFRALNPDKVQYSWWAYRFNARARNIGWRIDYFFVTQDLMKSVKDGFIEDQVIGSDHCPIGLDIK